MRVRQTQQVERTGVAWIQYLVSDRLGWLFREQQDGDFGVDAHLEVVESQSPAESAEATGLLLAAQIKSGISYFSKPADDGWWHACDASHVSYWLGHSLPVIVILFNPETKCAYWQHVNERTAVSTGKNWKILVPASQQLGADSPHALRPLARAAAEGEFEPAGTEAYRHRLCDRLLRMFPGSAISHSDRDHTPVTSMAFRMGSSLVEIVIHDANFTHFSDLLDRYSHPLRISPVVVVTDTAELPKVMPISPPPFIAHWSAVSGDKPLRDAIEKALEWARF
ncbi:DUF4365 domain-containing protein [Kitasatospora sp. NPDC048296]|uniref:DUF4365 domain-containing protein n=1 Tax=Kitasatospora sp. NPDC048296 TaxID=3364048 RepID=UPI0037131E1F